jgi:hypothetical protein
VESTSLSRGTCKVATLPYVQYLEGNDPDTSLQDREYGTDLAGIKYLNSFRDPGR